MCNMSNLSQNKCKHQPQKSHLHFSITIFHLHLFSCQSVHQRSDYWRESFPYSFQFPSNHITRDRFLAFLWCLHLGDPKQDEWNDKKNPLLSMTDFSKSSLSIQRWWTPAKPISNHIAIILLSKARISTKQYMMDKPTKWGYKLMCWLIRWSSTRIIYWFLQAKVLETKGSKPFTEGTCQVPLCLSSKNCFVQWPDEL